jgi:hypothetical protein
LVAGALTLLLAVLFPSFNRLMAVGEVTGLPELAAASVTTLAPTPPQDTTATQDFALVSPLPLPQPQQRQPNWPRAPPTMNPARKLP